MVRYPACAWQSQFWMTNPSNRSTLVKFELNIQPVVCFTHSHRPFPNEILNMRQFHLEFDRTVFPESDWHFVIDFQ